MAKHSGVIKSFGVAKGYGFIESNQVQGDVFFGRHDMPEDLRQVSNQMGLFEFAGREVYFGIAMKDGKQHATELLLAPTEGMPLVGAVKSFNATKGYGFFSCSALQGADVFFAKRDVPFNEQTGNLQGRAAVFTPAQQADGKAQAKDIKFCAAGAGGAVGMLGGMAGGMPAAAAAAASLPHVASQLAGLGLTRIQMSQLTALTGGMLGAGGGFGMAQGAPPRGAGGLSDGQGAQGTVKTFNSEKGFGFISCPASPSDIYFKSQEDITVGMDLAFNVKIMPDGKLQARDLVAALSEGQTAVGTVATYNGAKGFGFIRIPDQPNDVHFKKEVVQPEFQQQELVGKTVRFTITIHNGKPQAQTAQFLARPPVGYVPPLDDGPGGGAKRPAPSANPYLGLGTGLAAASPAAKRPRVGGLPAGAAGWVSAPAAWPGASGGGPSLTAVGQMTGVIKSFNPGKGFGFIESPTSPGADVYFKASHLGQHAHTEGLVGTQVSFHASSTPDGKLQGSSIQMF